MELRLVFAVKCTLKPQIIILGQIILSLNGGQVINDHPTGGSLGE